MQKDCFAAAPIRVQNEFNTYLYTALPLCVALAVPGADQWFDRRYVSLFAVRHDGPVHGADLTYPYTHVDLGDAFATSGLLRTQTLATSMLRTMNVVADVIRDKVGQGACLVAFVDENHLRGLPGSYVHEFLIYGFDDRRQMVKAVGFDDRERFTCLEFGYREFDEAFERGLRECSPSGSRPNLHSPIQLLEPETPPPGRPLEVVDEVQAYLAATPFDLRRVYAEKWWWDPWRVHEGGVCRYGIECYEHIAEHVRDAAVGGVVLDTRIFHLLAEHKHGLARRMAVVAAELGNGTQWETFLADWDNLVREVERCRMVVMRYWLRRTAEVPLRPEQIDHLRKTEYGLLERFLGLAGIR